LYFIAVSAEVEGIARLTKYFSKISSWNKGKLAELKYRKVNDNLINREQVEFRLLAAGKYKLI